MQPVSFPLEGKWPFLGEAPQGHGAVGGEVSLRGQSRTEGRQQGEPSTQTSLGVWTGSLVQNDPMS